MKKIYRVRKNEEFSQIIALKQCTSNAYFVIYSHDRKLDHARVGISVSKKLGNAVMRNKIKRQVREMVKAVVDFDGISRKDLALLLYLTHDMELSYDDAGVELNRYRAKSDDISIIITTEKVNKYSDTKFASFLQL